MSTDLLLLPDALPAESPAAELVRHWLSGRGVNTRESYRFDLQDFAAFVGADGIQDAAARLLASGQAGANRLVLAYRSHMLDAGRAPATINRRLAALRSLVRLGRLLGFIEWPLDVQNVRNRGYRDTAGPGVAAFKLMLAECEKEPRAWYRTRNYAMLRLLFDLGLRVNEAAGADLADCRLAVGTIAVMPKGQRQREVLKLPDRTAEAIGAWLEHRGDDAGPLFLSRLGRRWCNRSVYAFVVKCGKAVGVRCTPHALRHSAITHALDLTNGNTRAVQKFSRHRNLSVLTVYDDRRGDGAVAGLVAASV